MAGERFEQNERSCCLVITYPAPRRSSRGDERELRQVLPKDPEDACGSGILPRSEQEAVAAPEVALAAGAGGENVREEVGSGGRVVDCPEGALEELLGAGDVLFVSLDGEKQPTGEMETD